MPQGKLGIRYGHLGDLDELYALETSTTTDGGILLESSDGDDFIMLESSTDVLLKESA